MKLNTNIKPKKYYDEANNMSPGWGNTLRWIDGLKDKLKNKQDFTLEEFCYTLYGDGWCSHTWEAFKLYCERDLKYSHKKMVYECWSGLFKCWVSTIYDRNKNYEI